MKDGLRAAFSRSLPIPAGTEPHLKATLEESLQRTGNFIRAQLAFSLSHAYGASEEQAAELAIALEYFHTASLLFDDLPSMDDAESRRGAPCIHRLFGEGSAILTALAFINRGYAMTWEAISGASAERQRDALRYLEFYLGLGGLLNGQSRDLQYTHTPPEERMPQQVAMGKTVGLIRLSLVLPPIVFGARANSIRLLNHLAVFWGLAYQAIDDLKDVLHDEDRAGKSTARDTLLDRPNLVAKVGPELAVARLRRLVNHGSKIVIRLQAKDPATLCLEPSRLLLEREAAAICGEMAGVAS